MCQFIDYAKKLSHHQGICACDLKVISVGGCFVSLFLRSMYYSIEKLPFSGKDYIFGKKKFSVSEHVPHMLLLIKLDHRFNYSAKQIQIFAFMFLGFFCNLKECLGGGSTSVVVRYSLFPNKSS